MDRLTKEQEGMPTVKDLAEGLNVEPERIAALLESVRKQKANEKALEQQPVRTGPSRIGITVVLVIVGLVLFFMALVAFFTVSTVETPGPAPTVSPEVETDIIPSPTSE